MFLIRQRKRNQQQQNTEHKSVKKPPPRLNPGTDWVEGGGNS